MNEEPFSDEPASTEAAETKYDQDEADKRNFLKDLKDLGSSAGNKTLREKLGWESDKYWRVQNLLVDDDKIEKGRGKGGSVTLKLDEHVVGDAKNQTTGEAIGLDQRTAERDLYEPIKRVLSTAWVRAQGFDNSVVEITAHQGARNTGGTWTRPDVSVVAVKSFVFFPETVFDVVTFEVKPSDDITVSGVFEAISHREASTQAYVIYHSEDEKFEKAAEATRIIEVSKRYGIGVIVAADPENYDEWTEKLPAERQFPNAAKLDAFIRSNFTEEQRNQIIKWQK